MKPILLATTLIASPVLAQTSLAPFADPTNCAGLIYYQDFTKAAPLSGWNYGGTGDLGGGNSPTGPSPLVATGSDGLTLTMSGDGNTTMINTHNQFYHTYGYYEMTADLDIADNMNSALWLMAQNGGWPPEIDVEETQGHTGDTAVHSSVQGTTGVSYQWNMPSGGHVWGMNWTPQTITFYIDGQQVAQSNTPADFQQPMFLILSGIGSGGGTGHMTVKDIRVFTNMQEALACVPKASATPPPQMSALTDQIQQTTAQAEQLRESVPAYSPPPPTTFTGYNPQFTQYSQQAQQQLQQIQSQIKDKQLQIQNYAMPTTQTDPSTTSSDLLTQPTSPPKPAKAHHLNNDNDADDQ